jgi:tRNA pseudouridine55 synthase
MTASSWLTKKKANRRMGLLESKIRPVLWQAIQGRACGNPGSICNRTAGGTSGTGNQIVPVYDGRRKRVLATLELGIETDTLDPTGRVTAVRDVPRLSSDFIRETAKRYEGKIQQTPPAYSAVKHKGSRAYALARKGLPVKLKERTVTVHSLSIDRLICPEITMRIRCGGGTYIRTLAADLARDLGPGGRLKTLRRLKSGAFDVADAILSGDILPEAHGQIQKRGISLLEALPDMDEIVLDETLAEKVRLGYQPVWNELARGVDPIHSLFENTENDQTSFIKLVSGDKLLAIAKKKDGEGGHEKVKFERVFS